MYLKITWVSDAKCVLIDNAYCVHPEVGNAGNAGCVLTNRLEAGAIMMLQLSGSTDPLPT